MLARKGYMHDEPLMLTQQGYIQGEGYIHEATKRARYRLVLGEVGSLLRRPFIMFRMPERGGETSLPVEPFPFSVFLA